MFAGVNTSIENDTVSQGRSFRKRTPHTETNSSKRTYVSAIQYNIEVKCRSPIFTPPPEFIAFCRTIRTGLFTFKIELVLFKFLHFMTIKNVLSVIYSICLYLFILILLLNVIATLNILFTHSILYFHPSPPLLFV